MSFFDDMADLAAEFFDDDMFTDATITCASAETYNQYTGEYAGSGTITLPCRAVCDDAVESRTADGRIVFSTVLTLNVEPKTNDKITIKARTFIVDVPSTIAPDGTPILYSATVI